jgi:hypothetical protein
VVRRSLRMGIRLGVLAGVAFAVFKIVQSRRPAPVAPEGGDPWAKPPRREPAAPQPDLVRPAMLESVSVRDRPPGSSAPTSDPAPAPAAPEPATPAPEPAVAETTAPAPIPEPAPAPEPAAESTAELPVVEPDDDEVVILSEGDDTPVPDTVPLPRPPAEEVLAEQAAAQEETAQEETAQNEVAQRAEPVPAKKAAAKKAVAKKAAAKKAAAATKVVKEAMPSVAWVEPEGDVCPGSHPIKAKLRSGIFHLPGMAAYGRTTPDRCYADEAAAQSDGLRRAVR